MGVAYLLFGGLPVLVMGGCLLDLSWRVPLLGGAMAAQLRRSAETIRGARLD